MIVSLYYWFLIMIVSPYFTSEKLVKTSVFRVKNEVLIVKKGKKLRNYWLKMRFIRKTAPEFV